MPLLCPTCPRIRTGRGFVFRKRRSKYKSHPIKLDGLYILVEATGIEPARMFINSITYRLAVTALCQKSLDTIATALVNIGHPARVSLQSLLKTLMSHLP